MQFKMLVFTFKAVHGMEPGYLRVHLSSITYMHHIRIDRKGLLWLLSIKEDLGDEPSLFWHLPCRTSSLPELRLVQTLMVFWKALKVYFFIRPGYLFWLLVVTNSQQQQQNQHSDFNFLWSCSYLCLII